MSLDRRGFVQLAGAMGVAAMRPQNANAAETIEAAPPVGDDPNTSDIIVESLVAFGATHAFGIVGDGINLAAFAEAASDRRVAGCARSGGSRRSSRSRRSAQEARGA